jgi:hypothetical protein
MAIRLPVISSTVPITVVFALPVVEVNEGEVIIGSVTVDVLAGVDVLVNVEEVDAGDEQAIRLKVTKNDREIRYKLLRLVFI